MILTPEEQRRLEDKLAQIALVRVMGNNPEQKALPQQGVPVHLNPTSLEQHLWDVGIQLLAQLEAKGGYSY